MEQREDFSQRFSFDQVDARGCYVRLNQSIQEIQATHHYPPELAKLLNQFAVSAVLLRDTVKLDGGLSLQYRTSGAIRMLIADCSGDYGVRAICEFDMERFPNQIDAIDLRDFGNDATLTITMTPKTGNRYQGIVPIESASLADCLQDYFLRSEQLPSRFVLQADGEQAVGMSLHAMPNQDDEMVVTLKDDWNRLTLLTETVEDKEMLLVDSQTMLNRLFHEENCRLYEKRGVRFYCDCSRERSAVAIKSLGKEEVLSLMEEQEIIAIDCHFCFQRYEFDHDDLADLVTELEELEETS